MDCGLDGCKKRGCTRKEFLEALAQHSILSLCFAQAFSPSYVCARLLTQQEGKRKKVSLAEARYYRKLEGKRVQCILCPHGCEVTEGERGECGVRENIGGTYYSLNYGRPCAQHVDPVEKKPLFHVFPGVRVFSIAAVGCNLNCLFCQNWQISQADPEEVAYEEVSADEIVKRAMDKGCPLIAYTYSEPTVFFEYMLEIAKKAHEKGIINTCHSNGFINPEPLSELYRYIDAANIDLKGFTSEYYSGMCGGALEPVLESLKAIVKKGVHLELTNLMVPTKNDKMETVRNMVKWIKGELGPDVPVHFSRFYPRYKLRNLPPTPVETLERAREVALEEGLHFVYIGNVPPGHEAENTYCPHCHKLLVERRGYVVKKNVIQGGECPDCKKPIPGRWE